MSEVRPTDSRRTPRVLSLLLLAMLAVTALTLPSSSALAQSAVTAEEFGLSMRAGFGNGRAQPGTWMPVEVTVAPRRLVSGTLSVLAQTNYGSVIEELEIEVSAGGTKVFRHLMPPGTSYSVQLDLGDGTPIVARARLDRVDGHLIGWLGTTVPDRVPPVRSTGLDSVGSWVAVAPEWLERSPRGIDGIDTLVASPAALAALTETGRTNLATAVVLGQQLVVAADGNTFDPGVVTGVTLPATAADQRTVTPSPAAFTMTAGQVEDPSAAAEGDVVVAAAGAGRGRLTVVAATPGTGELGQSSALWGHVTSPRTATRTNGTDPTNRTIDTIGEVVASGATSLPSLPWLGAFLLAYALIVGPVNGFLLTRMKRPEWAWGTVPLITLVFVVGAFAGSRTTVSELGTSARVGYWVDGLGGEVAVIMASSPNGGSTSLRLPGEEWDVTVSRGNAMTVDRDVAGTTANFRLGSFEQGGVFAQRAVTSPPPLQVEASVTGEDILIEVTNVSGRDLSDVTVNAATASETIGDLAAGATERVKLSGLLPTVDPWGWGFQVDRDFNGRVLQPGALTMLLRWGILDGAPGQVFVTAGEVPERDEELRTNDSPSNSVGRLFVVGVTPELDGAKSPFVTQRELLTLGFGDAWRPGPLAIEGQVQAVLRYRLPNDTRPIIAIVPSLDRGMFQGQFNGPDRLPDAPPVAFDEACFEIEVTDQLGQLLETTTLCGEEVMERQCPPEAVQCDFDSNGGFTWCDADGSCTRGTALNIAQPEPEQFGQVQFEAWSVTTARWEFITVDQLGADGGLEFVNPLGEILLRASGEMFPFDFSGRGIAAFRGVGGSS